MNDDKFTEFWAAYPHKVGKKAAEKKYWIVRRDVDHDTIMHGLALYKETKPDWKAWCNPTTWLHQGRWEDQPADEKPPPIADSNTTRPCPQYLRRNVDAKPRETPEQRRHKQLRADAHEVMRKRGYEPMFMPMDMYKAVLAEVMSELESRAHA